MKAGATGHKGIACIFRTCEKDPKSHMTMRARFIFPCVQIYTLCSDCSEVTARNHRLIGVYTGQYKCSMSLIIYCVFGFVRYGISVSFVQYGIRWWCQLLPITVKHRDSDTRDTL